MLDKLRDTEQKYIGIEDSLADPEIMSRPGEYGALMKEYKALTPVVEKYRQYRNCKDNIEGINQMLEGELDRAFLLRGHVRQRAGLWEQRAEHESAVRTAGRRPA